MIRARLAKRWAVLSIVRVAALGRYRQHQADGNCTTNANSNIYPRNPPKEEHLMGIKRSLYLSVAASAFAACLAAAPSELRAQATVAIDNDDIGGVVTGPS